MKANVQYSILFASFAVLQFVIISVVTMFFYSGGDYFSSDERAYSFFGSFLSDLGRTRGFAGNQTYGTALTYAIALGLMGIGTLIFFIYHRFLLVNGNRMLVAFATTCGVIAGLGYIGVAATP